MIITIGTPFLLVVFYLICLISARVSVRPVYKRMWMAAATGLGIALSITVLIYIIGYVGIIFALSG